MLSVDQLDTLRPLDRVSFSGLATMITLLQVIDDVNGEPKYCHSLTQPAC